MLILVVEDDPAVAESIALMLRGEGHNVQLADCGADAVAFAKDFDFDAITLDLSLPDIGGIEVLRRIRAANIATPVLVLSGTSDIAAKVEALGLGADDYLTKPFHTAEFLARLDAIVRRDRKQGRAEVVVGELRVDLDAKQVERAGRPVRLSPAEWSVMEILASRFGRVVTQGQIYDHLYGGRGNVNPKVVQIFISKLRHRLGDAVGGYGFIRTIWGVGWQLEENAPLPAATIFKRGILRDIAASSAGLEAAPAALAEG